MISGGIYTPEAKASADYLVVKRKGRGGGSPYIIQAHVGVVAELARPKPKPVTSL